MSARQNTAVIVVDMQAHFLSQLDSVKRNNLVDNHLAVLDYCREKDVPVVGLRYSTLFYGKDYVERIGTGISEVKRHKNFWKSGNNGFSNHYLKRWLISLGVERLFLTGVFASRCIQSTAIGALENGFEISTSADLLGDNSVRQLEDSLPWFRTNGALFDNYYDLLRTL
ncbi:MAG: isochorismatase family protein [Nanoarchaeota archaeon]|nr:isochorismatase family protein [Nanoarchaeota archaeon]